MKKFIIILGILFAIFLMALGGGIYYASKKFTSDEIRKMALTGMKETFPNADIKLGKLDIGFGLYAKLELENLNMQINKKSKKAQLVSVKKLYAKIPLWSILLGSGKVEVVLDSPKVYYYQYSKKLDNWSFALEGKKKNKENKVKKPEVKGQIKVKKESSGATEIAVPAFLSRLKLNFDLKNLQIHYSIYDPKKRNSGSVNVSIFRIKNLNFDKETVIQIKSNIDVKEVASVDIDVLAELYLNKLIEESKLPMKTEITLNNIKLAALKNPIPEIKTNLNLEVLKDGGVRGDIKTKFGGSDLLSAKYAVTKKDISINSILVKVKIKEMLDMIDFENNMVDLDKTTFTLNGNTTLNNSTGNINVNLKYKMNPGVNFNYETVSGSSVFNGSYKNNKINLNSITKIFDGTANVVFDAYFDPNVKNFDVAKMKPFKLNVDLNNMKLTRSMIAGIVYNENPNKKKEKKVEVKVDNKKKGSKKKKKSPAMVLPSGDIKLSINQVKLGKDSLAGNGHISIRGSKVQTKKMNLKIGDGTVKLTHTTLLKKNNILDNSFNMIISNINFTSFSIFLPPSIDKMSGTVNVTSSGKVIIEEEEGPVYSVKVDMKATNGEIKGLNLQKYVEGVVNKVSMLKKVADKKFNITDSFELFLLQGHFANAKYNLSKFTFNGIQNNIKVNGKGYLYPPPLKKVGVIELTSEDNIGISHFLDKEAGTRILPIKLKGIGFALKPDAGYTMKKLAKKAVKKQVKKQAKKAVKKHGAKLLKGLFKKSGGSNPLKGLFGN